MGKRRKGGHAKKAEEYNYDSDDPRAYEKEKAPDPSSREYFYDDVDEFHASKDKVSLEGGGALEPADSSENEEEILGWEDGEEDEDDVILKERLQSFRKQQKLEEIASDLEEEGDEDDDGGVDSKSWGKRKQLFYDTDYVDDDLPGLDQAEEEAQQDAEEREALAIQSRMAEALQEDDFGLDIFQAPGRQLEKVTKDDMFDEEKVTKDLSKLSKREKLEILKKESPEFLELIGDFKIKMHELIDQLQPLVALVKNGVVEPGSDGAQYIHTKYQLYLSYCMNISFYMILKAKHAPVTNHPVIGRILAFRKLISELQPVDEKLEEEIQSLLSREPQGDDEVLQGGEDDKSAGGDAEEQMLPEKRKSKKAMRKRKREAVATEEAQATAPKKKNEGLPLLSEEELKALDYYKSVVAKQKEKKAEKTSTGEFDEEPANGDWDEENEKRGITYQISKNRGLTPRKRKELRTPRVKHRMKFRKAKIRRKGQVRESRTEVHRYGGEASGIRAGVVKSVKIR